jgi:hypothetical protein
VAIGGEAVLLVTTEVVWGLELAQPILFGSYLG